MTVTAIAAPAAPPPIVDRRLLSVVFAGLGAVMAAWGARMPAVQAAAHLTPGQLAVVLLAAAGGMVIGLQIGGRLAHRHGPAHLLTGPAVVFGLALALLGQCHTLTSLTFAALAFGLGHGLLDVGANAAAINVERAYKRRIMSSLHAAYSLGALGGAAVAAATTWAPYQTLFAAVGLLAALTAAAAMPLVRAASHLNPRPDDQPSVNPAPGTSSDLRTVWLLGALAAACLIGEGAAADWSAVHLRSLNSTEAPAAAAYAAYSAAMAAGRLFGDRLITRFGPTTVVRAGAALAAAGLLTGLAIGTVPAALAGWTLLGLGLSTLALPALLAVVVAATARRALETR
ncbi:MFS transporter [Streptomyces sp. NPDC047009]|uniref:MFS transporter n=1 Tax=Streptomyces sp. NPDC047009 TaxID=3154496 RepID=UPI0033E44AF6